VAAQLSKVADQVGSDLRAQSRIDKSGPLGYFFGALDVSSILIQEGELHASVPSLIESYFPCLRRPVRKNLSRLTCAFLRLAWSIRFGYGGLHLTSIARLLPQGKKFKSSYKWLSRFPTRGE